jgi:hypothetical protein
MLSLDLFTSKFEESVRTGAVDPVMEQDQPEPQEKIPTNINQFTTDDNRTLVKKIWAQISQHAINDTSGWLTLEWPGQPAATLSRNQVWTVINKIAKMPTTQRNAFAVSTLGDRNAFLTWMNSLKIIPRPAPKKDVPKGQQSLDLKELDQKKSSEDSKFKSTRLDRLKTQARARHPAAASDTEAMVADFVDQQDQDQAEFNRVKNTNRRQDELLKQITDLNQTQDQEIDNLEGEEARLQQNIKQIQSANAELAQKLAAMSQRRVNTEPMPAPTPQVGVSVATDKVAPVTAPVSTSTPAIDPRARRYAQKLRQQLNQLQTMVALKAPEDQSQLKQDIDALKAQLAKLQQQQPIDTATQATVGGQAADVMPPAQDSADTEKVDDFIDLTGVDDVLAQFRQPAKKSAKKKSKKQEPEFELTEENKIPLKKVFAGYTITFNPATKTVSAFRGLSGPQQGNSVKINNATPGAYLRAVRQLLGDEVAEGSVFGQQKFDTQMDLAKLKSQLTQPKSAQSAPAEPQPVAYQPPARLSDLQLRKQRVDNLAGIKQTIEQLQARATRGGRELPPGLAADLEDYFTTADIDTDYDEMMSKYQRQLAALQKYLNLRRAVWAPKKETNEMKASELQEGGPQTWTVHFTDGTTTQVRVPNDETDPAKVRAFFAKKGKTVKKFDYGFVQEPTTGPGPERHEPGSGSARSARTGEALPENSVDRSGQKMYQAQEVYMLTHNGQEVAFYTLKDLKRAEQDAQDMQRKLGGEVHLRKVMRETEQQPQDDVMKRLFKDFGDIFGKQPSEPKSQEPEKKEVKEMGRAGYNPLTSQEHWYEVERQLAQLINDRTLDPESRAEARQRYLEKRKEAQQKGWAK